MKKNRGSKPLALVLSGGGARGAYEAGVIHYIRTMLPEPFRSRRFPIQCGSSVGAINTCFMAATAGDLPLQGQRIMELWRTLQPGNIYWRNPGALFRFFASTTTGLLRNMTRLDYFKERHGRERHFVALFDTAPFHSYLQKVIQWEKIRDNVKRGLLEAVSVVATRMRTGQPEIFLQKGGTISHKGELPVHSVDLGPEHAMASAAIPIVFPNIPVGNYHYVDGSVRLNTPLSPAIQFGAQRILVISLHAAHTQDQRPHSCPETQCPPGLGEHLGKLFNAFFLDRLKYDIDQLKRINQLIDASERIFGSDYLDRVNKAQGPEHCFRKIDYLQLSPSIPLSSIFADWHDHGKKKTLRLSWMEKVLMRLLDVNPALNWDLLSYLTFEQDYLGRIIELGFEDARRQHEPLCRFLGDTSLE